MKRDTVTELKKPETFVDDPLTDILRSGVLNPTESDRAIPSKVTGQSH
ncbi:MAG: hypothetical protein U9Q84_03345 [Thermodesulfobacteriota bacterium]|nr:hypothetical protein [Thermodesulfobacteriota bacterium]